MSGDGRHEHEDHKRVQRVEHRPAQPASHHEGVSAPDHSTAYADSLLNNPQLSGRGNSPVSIAALQWLQSTYGNRAVQRFLQRQQSAPSVAVQRDAPKPRWADAGEKSPNASKTEKGKVRRLPLEGLPGNTDAAETGAAVGGAKGKAIALVPESVSLSKEPAPTFEVLLHLHGYGVGYRQRKTAHHKVKGMEAGTIRDIDLDKTGEQIEASGRPMVGVLPQGNLLSRFGNFQSDTHIEAVFKKLEAMGHLPKGAKHGRVVFTAHSGGGDRFISMGKKLPQQMAEVALFDAINSWPGKTNEQMAELFYSWVKKQLDNDLKQLKGMSTAKEKEDYLKTSLRFRAYHSTNVGYVDRHNKLKTMIDGWFQKNAGQFGGESSTVYKDLRANYQVIPTSIKEHERVMGEKGTGGKRGFEDALGALAPAPGSQAPSTGASTAAPAPMPTVAPPDAGAASVPADQSQATPPSTTPSTLPADAGASAAPDGATADPWAGPAPTPTPTPTPTPAAEEQQAAPGEQAAPAARAGAAPQAAAQQPTFKKQTYELSDKKKVKLVKGREAQEAQPATKGKKAKKAVQGLAEIEESPAEYTGGILKKAFGDSYDPKTWFSSFATITFLGVPFNAPIHTDLATHLKGVEGKFLGKYGTPEKAREKLKLSTESIKGGRKEPTSAAISMHLFGLAVDLNYTANPFISSSANPVFNAAGLLVNGKKAAFKGRMKYAALSDLDKTLETYFSYIDEKNKAALEERLKNAPDEKWTEGSGKKKTEKTWKGMTVEDAVKQIKTHLDIVAGRWQRTKTDPKNDQKGTIQKGGFMDLSQELVEGMDLDWGGSYGDIMHFDLRDRGTGKKIHQAIGPYLKDKRDEAAKKYEDEKKAKGEQAK